MVTVGAYEAKTRLPEMLRGAHYLELAIRYGIPLATLNEGLRQAAEEEGVRRLFT